MRVAVIEDEPINANELITLIHRFDSGIIVDPVIDSIESSISYFNKQQPDLVFLDIELADGNSFEIFNHVVLDCPIIFTTAYDQYALKAFDENSISYLLKPITYEQIDKAFKKFSSLKKVLLTDIENINLNQPAYKENFLVKKGNKLIPLEANQIALFYSDGSITYIITNEDVKYISPFNLLQLEDMLNPNDFFRLNRQFTVHRSFVSHLAPYVKGQVKLHFNSDIAPPTIISRQKTKQLKEWLS